jgi:hypothetical protein
MEAFNQGCAMKLLTPQHRPAKPRRARRLMAAWIAYFTTVCASMAAAAAVVTETAPILLVTGL